MMWLGAVQVNLPNVLFSVHNWCLGWWLYSSEASRKSGLTSSVQGQKWGRAWGSAHCKDFQKGFVPGDALRPLTSLLFSAVWGSWLAVGCEGSIWASWLKWERAKMSPNNQEMTFPPHTQANRKVKEESAAFWKLFSQKLAICAGLMPRIGVRERN